MRTPLVAGLAVAVLFPFTACDDGGTTPIFTNTLAGVLGLIEKSFNGRAVIVFGSSLSDDFTFYFNPEELGEQVGDHTIPEFWTRAVFLEAVVDVFDRAYLIEISIDTSGIGEPAGGYSTYTAEGVPVEMFVMIDTVNAFRTVGTFTFEFRAEYNEANGREWAVTAWRDYTIPGYPSGRGAEDISFGALLVYFYRP
jgi:hypothetical protein